MWRNNTDCLCFPCATYELRRSLDLALLTKWSAFLNNAFGNPAYIRVWHGDAVASATLKI